MPAQFTTIIGVDHALLGLNAHGPAVLHQNRARPCEFSMIRAPPTRAPLASAIHRVDGIALAVLRIPDCADDVVDLHQRPFILCLARR